MAANDVNLTRRLKAAAYATALSRRPPVFFPGRPDLSFLSPISKGEALASLAVDCPKAAHALRSSVAAQMALSPKPEVKRPWAESRSGQERLPIQIVEQMAPRARKASVTDLVDGRSASTAEVAERVYRATILKRQRDWISNEIHHPRARLHASWASGREALVDDVESANRKLSNPSNGDAAVTIEELRSEQRQLHELLSQYDAARPIDVCPCCLVYDLVEEADEPGFSDDVHTRARQIAERFTTPIYHDSIIDFAPDTSVTTATEEVVYTNVPAEMTGRLFFVSDPRNWDEVRDQTFFRSVEPGEWRNGDFQRFQRGSAEYVDWCRNGKPGKILEEVSFPTSFDERSTGLAENVLEISHLQRIGHDPDATPLVVEGKHALLDYEYSLYICLRTQYSVGKVFGGIDVDEGRFRAEWRQTGADDNGRLGTLTVKAHKSVHYTQPDGAPPGMGTALNLVSPALTSLLMRELVFVGTRKALNEARTAGTI